MVAPRQRLSHPGRIAVENPWSVLAGTSFCRTGNPVYDHCWARCSSPIGVICTCLHDNTRGAGLIGGVLESQAAYLRIDALDTLAVSGWCLVPVTSC